MAEIHAERCQHGEDFVVEVGRGLLALRLGQLGVVENLDARVVQPGQHIIIVDAALLAQ